MARKQTARLAKALDAAARSREERASGAAPEPWSKVTVVLKERQILFLDSLALRIRAQTGAHMARAEIIRALVDALEAADLDPAICVSETTLRDEIHRRISGS